MKKIFASAIPGILVAILCGAISLPVIAVCCGAGTSFFVTRRYGVQRYYDSVGTILFLSLGAAAVIHPIFSGPSSESVVLFLLVFGVMSATVIIVKRTISYVLDYTANCLGRGRSSSRFWNAFSSIVGTIALIWSLVKIKYRLAKTGVIGVATPLGLGLNILGNLIDLPWVLEIGLDTTAMVFIGGLIICFHILTSWYEVIALREDPLIQASVKRSKEVGTSTAKKSQDIARKAAERSKEKASSATETSRDIAESTAERTSDDCPGTGVMAKILGIEK